MLAGVRKRAPQFESFNLIGCLRASVLRFSGWKVVVFVVGRWRPLAASSSFGAVLRKVWTWVANASGSGASVGARTSAGSGPTSTIQATPRT